MTVDVKELKALLKLLVQYRIEEYTDGPLHIVRAPISRKRTKTPPQSQPSQPPVQKPEIDPILTSNTPWDHIPDPLLHFPTAKGRQ
jgi:hypothetical protein